MGDLKEAENNFFECDGITGLPNKRLFFDRLSQAIPLAKRSTAALAVLFISLDCLKLINDTLGKSNGDELIRAVALRLKGCLRASDTVARPGRDEFMILLPEITLPSDAAVVARKIFGALNSTFRLHDHELFANACIGISVFPDDSEDASQLISHAYTAMLHAKVRGKNSCQFFSAELNEQAFHQMVIENSLRLAVIREEFFLAYQPQVDLRTGRISGVEALVRWQRPEYGVVYPGDFIRVLEENGLIVSLGEWVLKTACLQGRLWQQSGLRPIRMAVNFSARQFHQEDMTEMVSRVLEETGFDPGLLELELTESVFMENLSSAIDTLHALRKMGVHISIDDFGRGYSSLSYLKHFPVGKLKMVEPFISYVTIDPNDAIIAQAVVAMAHGLNMKVIAEGVERHEHLEFLRALECDELQGNIFSHPLSPEEAGRLLAEDRRFNSGWV